MINIKVGRNIMAMPQRDEAIEEIKRLEPPSPRLWRVKCVA